MSQKDIVFILLLTKATIISLSLYHTTTLSQHKDISQSQQHMVIFCVVKCKCYVGIMTFSD